MSEIIILCPDLKRSDKKHKDGDFRSGFEERESDKPNSYTNYSLIFYFSGPLSWQIVQP